MRTHIFIVLDRSGSMQSRKSDHIGGLKSFVNEQKGEEPQPRFTLVQFDDKNPFEIMYDGVDIGEVGEIKLEPRGMTPLYDAIGKTIAHAKEKIRVDEAPVFVVVTDGEENYSVEWREKKVLAEAIKEREALGWKFIFLGAGIDAMGEASKIGLCRNTTASVSNTTEGINAMYGVVSSKLRSYNSAVSTSNCVADCAAVLDFSEEDRNEMSSPV